MRRLVSLWVVPLVVLVLLLLPGSAEAFHVAKLFADPPGAGGGGRIFYLGRPIERGWDCTACHTEAPGRIEVALDVQPASLFDDFHYQLGQSYVFTVQLVGEHLGFSAGMSNFNAISLAFADTEGLTQGGYSGFDSNELTEASGVLTTTGRAAGVTSWTFTWTAPTEPGAGEITLYLGVVDGNGADSEPTVTRTDPFGDDVFMTQVHFSEGGAATAAARPAHQRGRLRPATTLPREERLPRDDRDPRRAAGITVLAALGSYLARRRLRAREASSRRSRINTGE